MLTSRQTIAECLRLPLLRERLAKLNAVDSWSRKGMTEAHRNERQRVAEEVERVERLLGLLPDDDAPTGVDANPRTPEEGA